MHRVARKGRARGESHEPGAVRLGRTARGLLRGAVFICGAVLMALEIAGSRVLAPVFGNSIFVWGSLISVVLLALTVGYYAGGRLADRYPTPVGMAALVGAAGVLVVAIPFLSPVVSAAVESTGLGPRMGPLTASLLLFLLPGLCLGTVSPYAVRLAAGRIETLGSTAGALYALSGAGSILGTLATAFVLIPLLGVRTILFTLGIVLLLTGVALTLPIRSPAARAQESTASLLLLALLLWLPNAPTGVDGAREVRDSFYHRIIVRESGPIRELFFDNLRQGITDRGRPTALLSPYTRYMTLGLLYVQEPQRALFVGLGGGSLPKWLLEQVPQVQVDVVELDPAVVEVARRLFGVPDDPRLRIQVGDGRRFLALSSEPTYDLIFLDAYNSDSIPFHLLTREYFESVRTSLKPGGVVVSNVIGAVTGPRSQFFGAVHRTIAEVFPSVDVFRVGWRLGEAGGVRNLILIAHADPATWSTEALREAAARAERKLRTRWDFVPFLRDRLEGLRPSVASHVFTDDYAPVDALLVLW